MTMGDRICILRAGRIEQIGAPLEVYARPANIFVAQFLASPPMNLLPARLEAGEGPALVLSEKLRWPVPAALAAGWARAAGGAVVLGIRPEDLHPQAAPGRVPVELAITAVEALGPETIVTGRISDLPALPPLRVRIGRAAVPRIGEAMTVYADLHQAHLFDPATEQAIPRIPQEVAA
jgi:ABC-type sugar transport system ATPase subunit